MKKLFFIAGMSFIYISTAYADNIIVNAQTYDVDCKVRHKCGLSSHHEIQIINTDFHPHNYNYDYQLCWTDGDSSPKCILVQNIITINSGQTWNNSFNGYMEPVIPPGSRGIYASTNVHGYQSATKIDRKTAYVKG